MSLQISLPTPTQAFAGAAALLVGSTVWAVWLLLAPTFSPLRKLPNLGPAPILTGHTALSIREQDGTFWGRWIAKLGHIFVFTDFLNTDRVVILDLRGIQYVLSNSDIYQKPRMIRGILSQVVANGLLVAEGADHKKQRRIMSPSFTTGHLREMTEIFVSKSAELRDVLSDEIAKHPKQESAQVEILSWLSRATLDIIGLAGFNYPFQALQLGEESSKLGAAFFGTVKTTDSLNLFSVARAYYPWLRYLGLDAESRSTNAARETMRQIGIRLIQEKQEAILQEIASGGGTSVEKGKEKDLLSLLIKANMDPSVPASQRMTVDEILNQIPTFIVAGHETTSSSTTWALYALSKRKDIQNKLREELRAFSHDNPTMDELNSLQYLDAVCREVLRFHAVVDNTVREAMQADVIPLSKPYTDIEGVVHSELRLSKGDSVIIPIQEVNKMPEIWGNDAHEFNPDRWFQPIPGEKLVPGVWSNILSFLGGSRACIGFRFAIVEMKALMFHLIRSFEFELAVPVADIGLKSKVVTRPFLKSAPEKGNVLPMIIKPAGL